jgi:hypothetical protein
MKAAAAARAAARQTRVLVRTWRNRAAEWRPERAEKRRRHVQGSWHTWRAVRRRRRRSAACQAARECFRSRARTRRAAGGPWRRRCRPASARSSRRIRVARAARERAKMNGSPANARFGRARRHVGCKRALAGSHEAGTFPRESIASRDSRHMRGRERRRRACELSFFVSGGWCCKCGDGARVRGGDRTRSCIELRHAAICKLPG